MDWPKTQVLALGDEHGLAYFRRRRITYVFKDGVPLHSYTEGVHDRKWLLSTGHRFQAIWELQEVAAPLPRKPKPKVDPVMRAIDLG